MLNRMWTFTHKALSVHASDFNSMDSTILDAKDMSKITWQHPDKSSYKCCQALNVRFVSALQVHATENILLFAHITMGGVTFSARLY